MKILPLGGAGEVGASCALLEIAGSRILIDAGIRVGSGASDPLPEFERMGEAPDTLVVTHAHTDHTGALPLVLPHIGDARIHMTVASLHLLEVLQGDAVRHIQNDDGDTGRVSYDLDDVEAAIARVIPHAYLEPFHPVPGRPDITFEYAPCGHILGAGALLIDSEEGRILWSGDYSITHQPTIGGFDKRWIRRKVRERPIDLVVTEGTYGVSKHPPRQKETERFLRQVEEVTGRGGRVLIPAFAVGRAQDITQIIRDAKLAGRLVDVPLYLDGMVQSVTSIYENIAHEMYPAIETPLRLLDSDLGIYKANGSSRAKLIEGGFEGPAIVVASSGMLMGGQSVRYGRAFAQDPDNAILISGYQDEESPGRALLSLKQGGRIRMGEGPRVRVKCQVGRYHTSAHADGHQIQSVIEAASPKKVALVHGEPNSLYALRKQIGKKRTVVLKNGKPFAMKLARTWKGPAPEVDPDVSFDGPEVLGTGPAPTESEVRELWTQMIERGERLYSEAEIARLFLGSGYRPADREILANTLADHRLYFITGSKIGQKAYRPRPETELVDMMLERGRAYQIPLDRGDLVLFSDGSPDLFLAAVARVDGDDIEAVIPFSSRDSFRRDWTRCKLSIDLQTLLRQKPGGYIVKWLEDVMKEARALPAPDAFEAYNRARQNGGAITVDEALPVFFPGRSDGYSSAMHVAAALSLASTPALFALQSDGSYEARPPAEAAERWPAFRRIHYVRSLNEGAEVCLSDGRTVTLTGVFYSDSFEARISEDDFTRVSYRRALLPSDVEHPGTSTAA